MMKEQKREFTAEHFFEENMEFISSAEYIPWEDLEGKTILITGATGLIGYTLVNGLFFASQRKGLGIKIIMLTRDADKGKKRFENIKDDDGIAFLEGSIENLPEIREPVDFIIHGACQTASQMFVKQPVETINTALRGTENLLELAREKKVQGFVYLSTMEVYGYQEKGSKIKEDKIGIFTPMKTRNSYPLSKIMCENMCFSYFSEYDVPIKIVRLTQTFGIGVQYGDKRIFAELGRDVIEGRDIVLKTHGETERSYLYTADAATAIMVALLKGEGGRAYNAANEETYCSILAMANLVADEIAMGKIKVRILEKNIEELGYASTFFLDIDTSMIRSLGWRANYDLKDMFLAMIADMKWHHGLLQQG